MKTIYSSCCNFSEWLTGKLAGVIFLMLVFAFTANGQPPKASIDQARNGSSSNPVNPVAWSNGNLNAQQAHYRENYSVPYRVRMENLPLNTPLYIDIEYDTKHTYRHALDFLTHYQHMYPHDEFGHPEEIVQPWDGVFNEPAPADIHEFLITAPGDYGSPVPGQPTDEFNEHLAHSGGDHVKMTGFYAEITGFEYLEQESLTLQQATTSVRVHFIAHNSDAVIAWGGHIASVHYWGTDPDGDPYSAGGIDGSPYHMRLVGWSFGQTGNQDRSLSAAAVSVECTEILVEADDVSVCYGESAELTAIASGGVAPYEFTWYRLDGMNEVEIGSSIVNEEPAEASVIVNPSSTTTYIVRVVDAQVPTDGEDCVGETSVTVTVHENLTCSIDEYEDVSCYGAEDGQAQVTVTNGVEPFSYLWKDADDNTVGGDSPLIENLGPGTYTVYVTDANGCETSCEITIDEPLEMTCSIDEYEDVSCYGAEDGQAQVTVTNGVEPFSYLWKDADDNTVGGDSPLIENLGPGTYTVYVTDANGCETSCEITIDEPLEMTCSIDEFHDASCENGSMDGWAQVSVTNGVEPFSYLWKDESDNTVGGDAALIENLGPGTYTVYITDTNGCETSCEVTIGEIPCEVTCETAYGMLEDNATCFIGDGFNNWGWTNLVTPSEDMYILPLYAGAANCVAENGELVGSVEIDYDGGDLTVKYLINQGYSMSEAHIYVGCGKYPVLRNGKETIAPGQYTHNSTGLDKVVEYTVLFENVDGPVYVIAHAVVCDVSGSAISSASTVHGIDCNQQIAAEKSASVEDPGLETSSLNVYPNPFTEKVSFEFVAGKDANARLEVTNLQGQRIAILLDKQVRKGELNRVEFMPSSEVSGIYIYRLFLDDNVSTGRIIYRKE